MVLIGLPRFHTPLHIGVPYRPRIELKGPSIVRCLWHKFQNLTEPLLPLQPHVQVHICAYLFGFAPVLSREHGFRSSVIGSTGCQARARQGLANNSQRGVANGKGPQQKKTQTVQKGSQKQPFLGPDTFPVLDSKPQVKKVIPGLSQPPASPVQSAWGTGFL